MDKETKQQETTAQCAIQNVIASADFRKDLQDAIESGRDIDYCWNGEDEIAVDTFDEGYAFAQVIEVLEKHLL